MATVLDLATVPARHTHFARSLVPQLQGAAGDPHRAVFAEGGYDPHEAHAIRPRMDRLFDCLENVRRKCPVGCNKRLPLNAIILHLNDDHHWTREQIVQWLKE